MTISALQQLRDRTFVQEHEAYRLWEGTKISEGNKIHDIAQNCTSPMTCCHVNETLATIGYGH
jgi:hypothetical protein